MTLEITDFIAGCMIQLGTYLKIQKNPIGWIMTMVTIIYWVWRASYTGFISQQFWHIVSFLMALHGYVTWRSNELVLLDVRIK
jgi:hypothetical protein